MGVGALLFAVSLATAALSYVGRFGQSQPAWTLAAGLHAAFIDSLLFAAFALHHSVFARPAIRQRVARLVSEDLERPVYVIVASLLLLLVVGAWRPVPGVAWSASGLPRLLLITTQACGLAITLVAAWQLGLTRLSGLSRPGPAASSAPATLRHTGFYGVVRHPIYFAWVLMVWPAADMTGSRLVFAVLSTGYLAIAVPFEERTLREQFGAAYDAYTRQVRWRMVPGVY